MVAFQARFRMVHCSDDGDVLGMRFANSEVVFMERRLKGTMRLWAAPFVALLVPKFFNLRTDPVRGAEITSNTCYEWSLENAT